MQDMKKVIELALTIRALEHTLLNLFRNGKISGTVHTCIGQELCAAVFSPILIPDTDAIFASHRGHGFFMSYGGPMDAFLAEILGKEGALCGGRGGSQHLHYKNFFSTGIQGSTALLATGYAWGIKKKKNKGLAIAQIGDGTLGEGGLYEAINFAAIFQLPVLFVLENNGVAQSTDTNKTTPGDVAERIRGFGLEVSISDDSDPKKLFDDVFGVMENVRKSKPSFLIIKTRRLMAHSKGDDNRPSEMVQKLWESDYLDRMIKTDVNFLKQYEKIKIDIADLSQEILKRPDCKLENFNAYPHHNRQIESRKIRSDYNAIGSYGTFVKELNAGLNDLIRENEKIILIGEDLHDPYGGTFKVTQGLSEQYPDNVFSTPISELGILGISNGLAVAGFSPIAEIMFSDFLALGFDQLINHASKFYFMYDSHVTCPVVVRTPSGARRGYGPTHSQSLENLLIGVSGLRIVALSHRHSPKKLLAEIVYENKIPTLFIENKLLYSRIPAPKPPLGYEPVDRSAGDGELPSLIYKPLDNIESHVTVVCYGGMAIFVEEALQRLASEEELFVDFFILTQIWPLSINEILASVRKTRKLVVVDENNAGSNFSNLVVAGISENLDDGFVSKKITSENIPIPCSKHLEDKTLPSVEKIYNGILSLR